MARQAFNPSHDPDDIDNAPAAPLVQRHTCFAHGCTMPGSIAAGNSNNWQCAWHYGAQPSAIPRITQFLRDWECLTYEITVGRQALTGQHCADPKVLLDLHVAAVERVLAATKNGGWGDYFERKVGAGGPREDYRQWLNRIAVFLGKRLHESLGGAR